MAYNDVSYMVAEADPYEEIRKQIAWYKANPKAYSGEQVKGLMQLANEAGMPFTPVSDFGRMAKNFAFGLGDSVTFGLLPDAWQPDQLTEEDNIANIAGEVAGFVVPMGMGTSLVNKGVKYATKAGEALKAGQSAVKTAEGASKLSNIVANGLQAAKSYATDLAGNLANKGFISANNKLANMVASSAIAGATNDFFEEGIDLKQGATDAMGALMLGGALNKLGGNKFFNGMRSQAPEAVLNKADDVAQAVVNPSITDDIGTFLKDAYKKGDFAQLKDGTFVYRGTPYKNYEDVANVVADDMLKGTVQTIKLSGSAPQNGNGKVADIVANQNKVEAGLKADSPINTKLSDIAINKISVKDFENALSIGEKKMYSELLNSGKLVKIPGGRYKLNGKVLDKQTLKNLILARN